LNKKVKQLSIHIGLFIVTVVTTTLAGTEWMFNKFLFLGSPRMSFEDFLGGFHFSIPFLLILSVHEFGHYFTARYHSIRVTLPYYIPLWLGFIGAPSFGTMGALIRIKEQIFSRSNYFDVGVAGPLAGFVMALVVIWYGFANLPEPEYIFQVHPEYEQYGLDYPDHVYDNENTISFKFGDNLIFWWFQNHFVEDTSRIPHPNEIIHYPYLLAGYLALFFTALNLLPIGQLDGGHVMFGLFSPGITRRINEIFFTGILFYSGLSLVAPGEIFQLAGITYYLFGLLIYVYLLYIAASSMIPDRRNRLMFAVVMLTVQYFTYYFTGLEGYGGWFLFVILIGRFVGVYHPPVIDNRPMSQGRMIVGWLAILVLILSFSPRPFIIE
jgi:hypothetical protein